MKLRITLGLFLVTFLLSAQSARMNRDIEVAEKILETLLEEMNETTTIGENEFIIGNNAKVKGTYLDGFGAMFSIASGNSLSPIIYAKKQKNKHKTDKSGKVTIVRPSMKKYHYDIEDKEASKEVIQENFKSVVETFVCEYGYLMRQLGENEKIMIRYGTNPFSANSWGDHFQEFESFDGVLAFNDQNKNKVNYSATISKAAINSFQDSRINENQLKEKIEFVFEEAEAQLKKHKDLELLASILKKIHKNNSDEGGFYLRNTSNYEKIDGLGAIYNLNVRARGNHPYFGFNTNYEFNWGENSIFFLDKEIEKITEKAIKEAKIAKEAVARVREKTEIAREEIKRALEEEERVEVDVKITKEDKKRIEADVKRALEGAERALEDIERIKADEERGLEDAERAKADKERALEDVERAKADKKRAKENKERLKLELDKSYPAFIEAFKNSVIEYGSIVKSLEAEEALIFKLKFPKCDNCNKMPKQLEITAKVSTLTAYRKDKISLDAAVNQLVVK